MPVEPGQNLLHYRIVEKIGEGGMGVVWKAVDTTLDREVAIKVLLSQVASQPERLARFDREAKLLASLNHPNVAAIYGFQQHEDVHFVIMELVGGEDLSQRIERSALPIGDAIEIAVQIAEALTAAHDRGVIHRDLKPANVRITPDGTVKVLDFGLAKSLEAEPSASGGDPSASPTMTTGGTAFGVILGTATYMSPEQARGQPVDRRTDMWAFGCVLYEMLTGRRAFQGETITDTLSAVISHEPDWALLPDGTPAATRRLLRRCLKKKTTDRVRDAGDARLELLEPDQAAPANAAAPAAQRSSWLSLVVAALFGAALVGAGWLLNTEAPPAGMTDRLPPVHQVTFTGDISDAAASGGANEGSVVGLDLAADGRTAVYVNRDSDQAVLIDLDGGGSQTLFTAPPGTTLYDAAWSPDGDRVYLMTWPYSEKVLSVARFGGEPRQELDLSGLAGLNGIFVRPLRDNRWLVFGNHNTLYIGRDAAALKARGTQLVGEGVFEIEGLDLLRRVVISDDGRKLAFEGIDPAGQSQSGISDDSGHSQFAAAWSGLVPVSWTEKDRALHLWRPTGRDVGDLLRVEVDPETGRPLGDPVSVYPRLAAHSVQVSQDGKRLALRAGAIVNNLTEITLDGTRDVGDNPTRARTRGTGRWAIHDVMPDGTLLAGLAGDLGWELFAIGDDDVRRSVVRRERGPSSVAASYDGRSIAITVEQPSNAVVIHDLDNNRSRTLPVPEPLAMSNWSLDGKYLVAMTKNSADRIVVIDVQSGEARTVKLACGGQCAFAYEGIRAGPEWPYFAATSEVDTWVINAETGELRHVADDTWNILGWQNSFIYFTRGSGQTDWPGNVLFRVPAAGGDEERLLDLPTTCERIRLGPTGRSVICSMDESRLDLWVVNGLGE